VAALWTAGVISYLAGPVFDVSMIVLSLEPWTLPIIFCSDAHAFSRLTAVMYALALPLWFAPVNSFKLAVVAPGLILN